MKVWKQQIAKKLEAANSGKGDKENVIWKCCTKLLEDDSGDVGELEYVLAHLLLKAYDLD